MGKDVSAPRKDASATSNAVFIDTNLDTHLAMMVSDDDTVSDLKQKIICEHWKCLPSMGQIDVHCLKVKRKGFFYHLSETMLVRSAFEGTEKNWFLLLEASAKDEGRPCSSSPTYMTNTPNLGYVNHYDSPKFCQVGTGQNDSDFASKGCAGEMENYGCNDHKASMNGTKNISLNVRPECSPFVQKILDKYKQIDAVDKNSVNEILDIQLDSSGQKKVTFFVKGRAAEEGNNSVVHCTSNGKNAAGVHQESDPARKMRNHNRKNRADLVVRKESDPALKMQNHNGQSSVDPGVCQESDPSQKMQKHNGQSRADHGVHKKSDTALKMQNHNGQNRVDPVVQKESDPPLKMQNHNGQNRVDPGVHQESDPSRKMQNHNGQGRVDPVVHKKSDPAWKMQKHNGQNRADPVVHQESDPAQKMQNHNGQSRLDPGVLKKSDPARKMQNHNGQNRVDPAVHQESDPTRKVQNHNGQNGVESCLVSQNNLITANCKVSSLRKDAMPEDSSVTLKEGFSRHDAPIIGSSENVLSSKTKSRSARKKKKSKASDDPSCSHNVNGKVDIQCEIFSGNSQGEFVLHGHKDNEMNRDAIHYASHKESESSGHHESVSTCVVKKNEGDDNKTSLFDGQSKAITTYAVPSLQNDVTLGDPFQDTLKPAEDSRGHSSFGLTDSDHLSEAKSGNKRKRKKSFSLPVEGSIKGTPLEKVSEHGEGSLLEAGQSAKTLAGNETLMSDKPEPLRQDEMGKELTDRGASFKLSNGNEAVERVRELKELKSRTKNKTESNMFLSSFTKTSDLNISNEDAAKNLHQTEGIGACKDAGDEKIGEPSQTTKMKESPKCVSMNDEARKKSERSLESSAKIDRSVKTNVQEVGGKPVQSMQIECTPKGGKARKSSRKRKSSTDVGENPKADVKPGKLDMSTKTLLEPSPGKANQVVSENSNKELMSKTVHSASKITIFQADAKEAGEEEIHKQDIASPLPQSTQAGGSHENRNKSEMHQNSNAKKLQESNIHEHEAGSMLSQTSHELVDKARKKSRKPGGVAEVGRSQKPDFKTVKVNILSGTPTISSPKKANEVETDNSNKEKVFAKTEHAISKINLAPATASVGEVGKTNVVFDDSTASESSMSKCSAGSSTGNSSTSGYSTDEHSDMDSQQDGSKQKHGSWKQEMKSISGTVASTIDNILKSSSSYKKAKLAAESQLEDIDSQAEPALLSTEPINKP